MVLLPVGATESLGPHLALGAGVGLAQSLALDLKVKIEREEGHRVLIGPAFPFALDRVDSSAITVRGHVLRDWIVDQVRSLQRLGFKNFICLSTHLGPRTLTALEEASWMVSRRGRFWGWAPRGGARLLPLSSALVKPADRARNLLRYKPDPMSLPRITAAAIARVPGSVRDFFRELPGLQDVTGKQAPDYDSAWLVDAWEPVRTFLAGKRRWKRSGYGLLPWNWAFFKAWALASVLLIILWMTMNLIWDPFNP